MADTAGESAKGTPDRDRDGSQQSRLVIGVAGGSGSGKTTVVRRIVEALGPDCVSHRSTTIATTAIASTCGSRIAPR